MDVAYRQFTTDELAARFEAEDVPYSLVNDRADVINDPQVEAMQALLTYQHPQAGLVRTPRPAAQYSNTPQQHPHPYGLGEHNHSRFCQNWVIARHKSHHCKRLMLNR